MEFTDNTFSPSSTENRQPPHNIEAEKTLLGALLLKGGNQKIPYVESRIDESELYREQHKLIYRAILTLYREGTIPDLVTLPQALMKRCELDRVGGLMAVTDIANKAVTAANIDKYIDIIKDAAIRREQISLALRLQEASYELDSDTVKTAREIATSLLDGAGKSKTGYRVTDAAAVSVDVINHLEDPKVNFPTGIAELDAILHGGLKEGLYLFGAVTGIGKTDISLQIADYVASQGHDVLYFSLEMSDKELVLRSLSRYMALQDVQHIRSAKSDSDIYYDSRTFTERQRNMFLDGAGRYAQDTATRLQIAAGMMDFGVDDVRAAVQYHVTNTGRTPLVVVDYMQILAPYDVRATDKQNADYNVKALKRLARDFGTAVVSVSAFNRANYRQEASLAALKESGALEYSADCVIALQFDSVSENDFDADAEIQKTPREIEAKVLKLRKGKPGGRVKLDYYPACHTFMPANGARAIERASEAVEIPNEGIQPQGKKEWV